MENFLRNNWKYVWNVLIYCNLRKWDIDLQLIHIFGLFPRNNMFLCRKIQMSKYSVRRYWGIIGNWTGNNMRNFNCVPILSNVSFQQGRRNKSWIYLNMFGYIWLYLIIFEYILKHLQKILHLRCFEFLFVLVYKDPVFCGRQFRRHFPSLLVDPKSKVPSRIRLSLVGPSPWGIMTV